jgi:hypothetical protein
MGAPSFWLSFLRKQESIGFFTTKVKMDSRFRGNDNKVPL